jgi:DNA-binding MarR family transcriptional regulator
MTKKPKPNEPRKMSDDAILTLVRLRSAGIRVSRIAKDAGCTSAYVVTTTDRIRAADLAESGESKAAVARGYW